MFYKIIPANFFDLLTSTPKRETGQMLPEVHKVSNIKNINDMGAGEWLYGADCC